MGGATTAGAGTSVDGTGEASVGGTVAVVVVTGSGAGSVAAVGALGCVVLSGTVVPVVGGWATPVVGA